MADQETPQFKESLLKNAKRKYEAQKSTSVPATGFDEFLKNLADPASSAALPVDVDTTYDLSQYFISSSHNTYLTGNQLWSKASTDPYKHVLKRRCRCIEIDVWDGSSESPPSSDSEQGDKEVKKLTGMVKKGLTRLRSTSNQQAENQPMSPDTPVTDETLAPTPWRTQSRTRDEPRVLHGYTATKEIPFRSVCEVIRDYAFKHSDLPLIVSLEVHCNPAQQEIMVEIMTDYWKPYLVAPPADLSDKTPLPALESLKKKILIKVKYLPPKKAKPKAKDAGNVEDDSPDEDDAVESVKKGKIIEALSKLGTYTRSYHFDDLSQPEASIPTHVFAVSEQKLSSLQEEHADALFRHNLNYFMRVYPKGIRVRSTNLDPAPFWRQGVQMAALNWQQMNAAMMLNEAMFEGTGGWVAKPEGYRKGGSEDLKPKRISFNLSVEIMAAQNLDSHARTTPNAFVKCELHVGSRTVQLIPREGKSKGGEWKRRSTTRHSKDPDFGGDVLEFKGVEDIFPELSFIRLKVCDDDTFQKDRLLGWICFRLDRFPQGLRLFRLRGDDAKPNGALLLLDSRMEMKESVVL